MTRFDHTREKTARSRRLRREATPTERILWSKLRSAQLNGESFRRQHPIGPYILDFYCPTIQLAIELDGGQHGLPTRLGTDKERDAWLASIGIRVLRFWNEDVRKNLNGVLDQIWLASMEAREPVTPTRRARTASALVDLPLSGGGKDRDRSS